MYICNLLHVKSWMIKPAKGCGPPTMNTSKYLEVLQFEDAITTLKVRCGMSNVKMNYKNNHQSLTCDMCHTEAETTIHLLKCTKYSTPALNDEILNKIWSCDESEEVTRALQKNSSKCKPKTQ